MPWPIAVAAALLLAAPALAQDRLTAEQLVARMLHPECVYPDLRNDPDFRVCGRHVLGRGAEAVAGGSSTVAALWQDDLLCGRYCADGAPRFGAGPSWINVTVSVVDIRYPPRKYRLSIASSVMGLGDGGDVAPSTDSGWGLWGTRGLSAEQVLEALARFRHQVVNEGCGSTLLWWDGWPEHRSRGPDGEWDKHCPGYEGRYWRPEAVSLSKAEDGSIVGACTNHGPAAEAGDWDPKTQTSATPPWIFYVGPPYSGPGNRLQCCWDAEGELAYCP